MELWTKTSRQFSTNSEREKRLIYLFWEKQWQKAFFDKSPGKILCDTEKGEKSAQREVWDFYAHMAHPWALLCKGLLSWFRKYHKRYFPHNKKEPCDRVCIGCAFALLIWLCLKQGSIDLGADCTGNVWGSDSVNYLHFRYPCWNGLNQCSLNIL